MAGLDFVLDANLVTKVLFSLSRALSGLLSYSMGVLMIVEPYLMMKYIGHYNVPKNFGWEWIDTRTMNPDDLEGNEYSYWWNYWVLLLDLMMGLTQIYMGIIQIYSIPLGIVQVWDILGLQNLPATL